MTPKTCQFPPCGVLFSVKDSRALEARFCSMACSVQGRSIAAPVRFWARVNKTDGCWLWTGAADFNGYGRIIVNRKIVLTHRFSYELARGPIPDGLVLDHLCRIPGCVNPSHLEAVTQKENMRRGARVARTHCKRGHRLADDNLEPYSINTLGHRNCVTCRRERARGYRAARYAAAKLLEVGA